MFACQFFFVWRTFQQFPSQPRPCPLSENFPYFEVSKISDVDSRERPFRTRRFFWCQEMDGELAQGVNVGKLLVVVKEPNVQTFLPCWHVLMIYVEVQVLHRPWPFFSGRGHGFPECLYINIFLDISSF